jgi:hypothetical protein
MDRLAPLWMVVAFAVCEHAALGQEPPAPSPSSGPIFRSSPDAPPAVPAPREVVRLIYVPAPGCPDEQALRTSLAGRLGYDPVDPSAPRVLRVVITPAPAGFSALAELRNQAGRVLWSRPPLADPDCRALVDFISVPLKFAIDPASSAALLPPAVAEVGRPPVPLPPASVPEPDRREPLPTPSSTRPKFRLGFRAGGTVGAAPSPSGTFAADAGVGWEHFSLAAELRADLPATGTVLMDVQLQTRILAGSLVPCGRYGWFFGCAVISVGGLWVEGTSPPHAASGASVVAFAGPRGGIEWPIPGLPALALSASVDALFTVQPITVRVMGANAWPMPAFSGLLGGGVVLRL